MGKFNGLFRKEDAGIEAWFGSVVRMCECGNVGTVEWLNG